MCCWCPKGILRQHWATPGQRTIRDFVRKGGVLVAVGDSVETFNGGDSPMLSVKREAALGRERARRTRMPMHRLPKRSK